MIDFDELFDLFLEQDDQNRFDAQGGYPSQRIFYQGKIFVATVDHDNGPKLDVYDMEKFKELATILVQMFCEEKGLCSYDEIKAHDEYEDFIESLIEGVYQLEIE